MTLNFSIRLKEDERCLFEGVQRMLSERAHGAHVTQSDVLRIALTTLHEKLTEERT